MVTNKKKIYKHETKQNKSSYYILLLLLRSFDSAVHRTDLITWYF